MTHYNSKKTSCKRGHPLSGDNLCVTPSNGKRTCKTCQRAHIKSSRAKGLSGNDPRHGTHNGYTNFGCRCDLCKKGSFEERKALTLTYKYGLSREEQEELQSRFDKTGCDICGSSRHPRIDHCHETGVVRGIVCASCNTGLGNVRDSVAVVENAIKYLSREKEEPKTQRKGSV